GAWHDAVYAHTVCTHLVSQSTRHSYDRGFGRDVDGNPSGRDHPADRAHVDDRSALCLSHARQNGLRHEELVLEVDLHAPVPEFGSDFFDLVSFVIPGVVHQDLDRGEGANDVPHDGLQLGGVGEIAVEVFRRATFGMMTSLDKGTRGVILDIKEE